VKKFNFYKKNGFKELEEILITKNYIKLFENIE